MMNQNNKNTFRKMLNTAAGVFSAAFADSTDYRSWCYESRVMPVSPAFRAW